MAIETFEDMEVWQSARALAKNIYAATAKDSFAKDFALRDQVRRASISIMSNIAEGFERSSNKEFIQFLHVSKGSSAEVRSQLYLAYDLKYMDEDAFQDLNKKLISISRQLSAFIKYLDQHSQMKRTQRKVASNV
jgi:four helix bundle protein